jgi:hypothetical protein
MAAFLHDDVLDAALQYIEDNLTDIYICSAEPSNYTEATSTYALGDYNSPSVTGPANDTSGRKTTVDAIASGDPGDVTDTGTATWVAGIDEVNDKLLFAQELSSSQAVTSGNTFTLTAFDINIPDPTS